MTDREDHDIPNRQGIREDRVIPPAQSDEFPGIFTDNGVSSSPEGAGYPPPVSCRPAQRYTPPDSDPVRSGSVSPDSASDGKSSAVKITLIICVTVCLITGALIAARMLTAKTTRQEPDVLSQPPTAETTVVVVRETYEQTAAGSGAEPPTEKVIASTAAAAPSSAAASVSEPAVIESGGLILHGGYVITDNTPSHAGLIVRSGPSPETEKLAVLPEGTLVEIIRLDDDEYCKVVYSENDLPREGWILQRHLRLIYTPAEEEAYEEPADGANAYVSYQTDSHAGLVVRSSDTYYSDKLAVIPEGTDVYMTGETGENGYCRVIIRYGSPDAYSGWVLQRYLVY